MKITEIIKIKNYRNLDGIEISFHPEINFIIGENNLGKSNLLKLLNILFNQQRFKEDDFCDSEKSIEIHFSLELDKMEVGALGDLFDPDNSNNLNLVAVQESVDDNLEFKHKESNTSIRNSDLKLSINYIEYDSLRKPSSELKFDKIKGAGKFLNHIIVKYLENNQTKDVEFIHKDPLDKLLSKVTKSLQKIKPFKDFSIGAILENNQENLLAKVIILADDQKRRLENLSYGVQFLTLIPLSLLEKLLFLNSKANFEKCIFEDESTGEKCFFVLMGLDEPEIHLHPYAQRALVKYLKKIVTNEEKDFSELLKELFLIDKLLGQIIIVSHSPNILLDDYKQIIRFYIDRIDNKLIGKSGNNISLDEKIEKQLLRNLPYIKEAFFSKVVILVEGDSELGAFPIFAERMEINLDELGISIIQAGGSESIVPLMNLLKQFGVPSVGIMDHDKESDYKDKIIDNLFFTMSDDFEDEIFNSFDFLEYINCMESEDANEIKFMIKKAEDLKIVIKPKEPLYPQMQSFDKELIEELKSKSRECILKTLRKKKKKTIVNGRELGKKVTLIPQIYQDVITRAKEL